MWNVKAGFIEAEHGGFQVLEWGESGRCWLQRVDFSRMGVRSEDRTHSLELWSTVLFSCTLPREEMSSCVAAMTKR